MTAAAAAAVVAVLVVMIVMVVAVLMIMVMIAVMVMMRMALVMQMLMIMGMVMVMGMGVGMLMGVGNTVVGVLVGMGMVVLVGRSAAGHMIVMNMHKGTSLVIVYSIIQGPVPCVKAFIFRQYPPAGVAKSREIGYNASIEERRKKGPTMADHSHEHDHAYHHSHGIAHTHGHVHENQKAVLNRLSRAIGHLEKVKRMVESGEDCSEVLIQLAAVRSALDNTGKVILKDNMRHCMVDAVAAGDQDAIDDLCQAIDKFMK